MRSRTEMLFNTEQSQLNFPSVRVRGRFRGALPYVKAGVGVNAAVLNQRLIFGFATLGSPTTIGRFPPNGAAACPIEIGSPLCIVTIEVNCQSPANLRYSPEPLFP